MYDDLIRYERDMFWFCLIIGGTVLSLLILFAFVLIRGR